MKKFLFILSLLCFTFIVQAQERGDTIRIPFRKAYSSIDLNYKNTRVLLNGFTEKIRNLYNADSTAISDIIIYSGTSPEGTYLKNRQLAEKRAEAMVEYIRNNTPVPYRMFIIHPKGIDWEGLITEVRKHPEMPHQQEILDILLNTPEFVYKDHVLVDGRKRQIEMLRGGKPYWWMYKKLFPNIRYAGAEIRLAEKTAVPQPRPDTVKTEPATPLENKEEEGQNYISERTVPEFSPIEKPERPGCSMALKTNLLYDAATILNAGIEFYLGRNWTTSANWMYSWWKTDRKHWYWRTYGGELAIRKYFGRKSHERVFTGHHLGLYGQAFTYDFETGKKGQLSDLTYGGGLEYGYSLPITRRLNLDFVTGVGYMGGKYKEYLPIDECYVWQATKKRQWFGPTKAEVSLVWLLGKTRRNSH